MGMMWQKLINAPAPTGIQFVGGSLAGRNPATSGTVTHPINSGLTGGLASAASSGDFVMAVFGVGSNADQTLSITDGTNPYTLIGSELYANDSQDANLRVAYKFITADTDITFGPTGGLTSDGLIGCYVFRGVDTTTPIDVTTTTATGIDTIIADPPAITPSTAGAWIVAIGLGASNSGGGVTYSSSNLTDFSTFSYTSGSNNRPSVGIGLKTDWTSGAFNPAAFTLATGDDNLARSWVAMSVALRPA